MKAPTSVAPKTKSGSAQMAVIRSDIWPAQSPRQNMLARKTGSNTATIKPRPSGLSPASPRTISRARLTWSANFELSLASSARAKWLRVMNTATQKRDKRKRRMVKPYSKTGAFGLDPKVHGFEQWTLGSGPEGPGGGYAANSSRLRDF